MNKQDHEALFRKIAQTYADEEGRRVLEETNQLPKDSLTPGLDARVRRTGRRRWPYGAAAGIAAAFIAVVLLRQTMVPDTLDPSQVAQTASPTIAGQPHASGAPLELIPLAFELPERFDIVEADLDNGKTIYHLADEQLDDVVLTMEADYSAWQPAGSVALSIASYPTYAVSQAEYQLLTFEANGITYTFTCRYDINTLVTLSDKIIRQL